MSLRQELLLAWAALVVVQVLTLAGAIGLLARMTPAIGGIIEDNEHSIEQVETMLVALGQSQADASALGRFEEALAGAQANVTEGEEPTQLARIDAQYQAAFVGDPTARERVTVALQALARINRSAMEEASDRASDVGRTGAWAAAVLGFLSLLAAVGMARRLERRVIEPTEATAAAVRAIEDGDHHRRCPVHGPTEIATLARGIETLRERPTHVVAEHEARYAERRLLLALLDREPGVAFLVDERGALLHANMAGTTALLDDPAISGFLKDEHAPLPPGFSREPLGDGASLVRGPRKAAEAVQVSELPRAADEPGPA